MSNLLGTTSYSLLHVTLLGNIGSTQNVVKHSLLIGHLAVFGLGRGVRLDSSYEAC